MLEGNSRDCDDAMLPSLPFLPLLPSKVYEPASLCCKYMVPFLHVWSTLCGPSLLHMRIQYRSLAQRAHSNANMTTSVLALIINYVITHTFGTYTWYTK